MSIRLRKFVPVTQEIVDFSGEEPTVTEKKHYLFFNNWSFQRFIEESKARQVKTPAGSDPDPAQAGAKMQEVLIGVWAGLIAGYEARGETLLLDEEVLKWSFAEPVTVLNERVTEAVQAFTGTGEAEEEPKAANGQAKKKPVPVS